MTLPALKAQSKGSAASGREIVQRQNVPCEAARPGLNGMKVQGWDASRGMAGGSSRRQNVPTLRRQRDGRLRTRSRDDVGVVDGVTAEGVTSGRRQRFHGYTGSTSCTGRAPVTLGCAGAITGSRSTKHGATAHLHGCHSPPGPFYKKSYFLLSIVGMLRRRPAENRLLRLSGGLDHAKSYLSCASAPSVVDVD